ncbi:MAG: GNVR domain-containing protein [Mariprofundales bacterium]|nr:GNVR domain-containing protein [Mariprofundales bacterium]
MQQRTHLKSGGASKGGALAALGGLGGLASLAGISLPGGGNTEENLAVLKSRQFLWRFIKDQKLMPILFAKGWDSSKGAWRERDVKKQPTMWDGYRTLTGILKASSDKKSGLVTVAVEWTDADLAAKWANTLVARLNDYLRQRAINEGKAKLQYLSRELARTQVEDIRKALFELISQEQKKAMLANTQVQYAFRVIDTAQPPDRKAKPKRSLIVVLSAFVAGFLAMIFVFVREGIRQRRLSDASE